MPANKGDSDGPDDLDLGHHQLMDYPGEAAAMDDPTDCVIGRSSLWLVYRRVEGDEGLTIHVFGPANGVRHEALRFDCFAPQPHYHLGWSYHD